MEIEILNSVIAETEISVCDYNNCSPGAQCIPDSSSIGYRCECKPVVIDGIEFEPSGDGFSCSLSLPNPTSGGTSGGSSISGSFPDNTVGTSGGSSGGTSGTFETSTGQLGIYPGIDLKPIVTPDGSAIFYTLRPDFEAIRAFDWLRAPSSKH